MKSIRLSLINYEVKSRNNILVDRLVALKSLVLSLSKISPEVLIDQNRFLPDLSYTFSQYFTAARHEINNLESYVVVNKLELAINLAL